MSRAGYPSSGWRGEQQQTCRQELRSVNYDGLGGPATKTPAAGSGAGVPVRLNEGLKRRRWGAAAQSRHPLPKVLSTSGLPVNHLHVATAFTIAPIGTRLQRERTMRQRFGKTLNMRAELVDSENSAPSVSTGDQFARTPPMPTTSRLCYAADGGVTWELPQVRIQAGVVFLQLSACHLEAKRVQPLSAAQ